MSIFRKGRAERGGDIRDMSQFQNESPEYAKLEEERAEVLSALGHWTRRCDEDPEYGHLAPEIERFRQRVIESTDLTGVRAVRAAFNVFARGPAIPKRKP